MMDMGLVRAAVVESAGAWVGIMLPPFWNRSTTFSVLSVLGVWGYRVSEGLGGRWPMRCSQSILRKGVESSTRQSAHWVGEFSA